MSTINGSVCPTFALKYASASDLGMRRVNNQDSLAVILADDVGTWSRRGHFLMIADGMGAHAAGELASKIAVDNIPHTYFKLRDLYPPAALRQAIRDANMAIHSKGQSSIGFQGMGTTCSCLVLLPQGALVAHIGDSRVYRLRQHVLEQLTFDHSLVWEMAAAGQMTEEDVPAYIPKNVITRSLGPHATVQVDLEGPYTAAPGDTFLLCSDGLSGPISDDELGAILACLEPDEAAATFVDLANLRGGPDNISLIIARVDGAALESSSAQGPRAKPRWPTAPLWVAAGVFAVCIIYCVMNQLWVGAAASAIGFLGSLFAAISGRASDRDDCPSFQSLGGPYGNGPYRKAPCTPNAKIVASLAEVAGKLRELPEEEHNHAEIDWGPFDKARSQAIAATERGDHENAVRHYCLAIRATMRQLREKRPALDSSIDGAAS